MKVWIFVEGESDVHALPSLWGDWQQKLGAKGWGLRFIDLDGKSKYFKNIGHLATEKLVHDTCDLVVGLPDLYPNRGYAYKHANLKELQAVQRRLVKQNLEKKFGPTDVDSYIARFYPSALKHDLEVLLLAATSQLQSRLKMRNRPRGWQHPPEDQNQNKPPKKVIEGLFQKYLKRPYRPITDSVAILRNADLQEVARQCPAFRAVIDWIGAKTGVPGY